MRIVIISILCLLCSCVVSAANGDISKDPIITGIIGYVMLYAGGKILNKEPKVIWHFSQTFRRFGVLLFILGIILFIS